MKEINKKRKIKNISDNIKIIMPKKNKKYILWPAGSFVLIFAFVNLSSYVGLARVELSLPAYAVLIIFNVLILPPCLLFLELSGYKEKLWNFWKSIPLIVHQGSCFLCLFWIGFISFKSLMPIIKKEYEKN